MTLTPELEQEVGEALAKDEAEPDQKTGRLGNLEKIVARQATQLNQVCGDVKALIWYHAEMVYRMKAAAAAQILNNPQIQDQLKAALMAKMEEQGGE